MVEYSRKNAKNAGVEHLIHFQTRPLEELSHSKKYGFIIVCLENIKNTTARITNKINIGKFIIISFFLFIYSSLNFLLGGFAPIN